MGSSLAAKIQAANKALLVEGKLDAVAELFAPDYVAHVTEQELKPGHEGIRQILALYQRAFSELRVEVEILVEAKDRIAWQRTCRARHTGAFKGFPATDLPMVWRDMVTSRFSEGRIAEEWVVTDLAERFLLARKR